MYNKIYAFNLISINIVTIAELQSLIIKITFKMDYGTELLLFILYGLCIAIFLWLKETYGRASVT